MSYEKVMTLSRDVSLICSTLSPVFRSMSGATIDAALARTCAGRGGAPFSVRPDASDSPHTTVSRESTVGMATSKAAIAISRAASRC
eukprot:662803-Prymnesium_polylepis.1